eukprot:763172-Hanusia_phi.AAC.1
MFTGTRQPGCLAQAPCLLTTGAAGCWSGHSKMRRSGGNGGGGTEIPPRRSVSCPVLGSAEHNLRQTISYLDTMPSSSCSCSALLPTS